MDSKEMRMERINRLLHELEYEVTRGFMEVEIDETIGYQFIVPVNHVIRGGIVLCRFETRPMHRDAIFFSAENMKPRLSIVGSKKAETKRIDQ